MLHYNFRNYEEFKERFGIQCHGNGVKSRKNKILLAFIKDRKVLNDARTTGDYSLLHIQSMAELKTVLTERIRLSGSGDGTLCNDVCLLGKYYSSALYSTDAYNGLCEDGDARSIRYVNVENGRVFKMKAGKFYRRLILETAFGKTLPEQVVTYLCEEMVQDWQSYALRRLPQHRLVVDDDFRRIYSSESCAGDFHSCMVDRGHHYFYESAVEASAASIENGDGKIIARCVIYNKVTDQYGKVWRLAERQYSTDCNDMLKRVLVDALIAGGYIDGYKKVGAGCGDAQAFVDNDGNPLSHLEFTIACDLDYGDTLSYQDSFKNYDEYHRVATNYGVGDLALDTTEGELEDPDREYDDWHECYCRETTTVYYHGREYLCDCERLDEFCWVEREDAYHHDDDVSTCEECGEYYLSDNGYYSDLTEEYYCCEKCMEKAEESYKEDNWTYSDYDERYYEDEDEVTFYMEWRSCEKRYVRQTIHTDSLDDKVESEDFHLFDGVVYDEIDNDTKLPYGMRLVPVAVEAA